jgi:hypothetical protein
MKKIHSHLLNKYLWYKTWHENPLHIITHWIILILVIILCSTAVYKAAAQQYNSETVDLSSSIVSEEKTTTETDLSTKNGKSSALSGSLNKPAIFNTSAILSNTISPKIQKPVPPNVINKAWFYVGNPGFSAGMVYDTSLALDSNNVPYVAYIDVENNYHLTIMKYKKSNNTWVSVGNVGFSEGTAGEPSLAFDSENIPYVAYRSALNDEKIIVRKFNGISWDIFPVGNQGFSAGAASDPSLFFNSNDVPYVAYTDIQNDHKATVMKFNGTNWITVGGTGFSNDKIEFPSLAIGPNNIPYVAYNDFVTNNTTPKKATVMKYDISTNSWIRVGNVENRVLGVSLAVGSNNIPYIAYDDYAGNYYFKATVMKYVGDAWVLVGNEKFSASSVDEITLALDSENIPYVTYMDSGFENKATVMKYNDLDNTWGLVGNVGFSAGAATHPSLVLDSYNVPYIAYGDNGYEARATVMNFTQKPLFKPTIVSAYADQISTSGANLNGSVNPNGSNTDTWYELPMDTTHYGLQVIGNGVVAATLAPYVLGGLASNTTYIFRVVAHNIVGTTYGDWIYFTTSGSWGWHKVGGFVSTGPAWAGEPSLAINSSDRSPYVAYTTGNKVIVKKFNMVTNSWDAVGNTGFVADPSSRPSLAFDSNNVPYVAYMIQSCGSGCPIYVAVKKFNAITNNWEMVGNGNLGSMINGGGATQCSLALDLEDVPYVVYDLFINAFVARAIVMKLHNGSWEQVGNTGFPQTINAWDNSLAIDSVDNLYVVYDNNATGIKAAVEKFDGTNWTSVGSGQGFSIGTAFDPSLAIGLNNVPYVAYQDEVSYENSHGKLTVMNFLNNAWISVGNIRFTQGEAQHPSLTISLAGTPYVAYRDIQNNAEATVMKYDISTNSWLLVGDTGFSDGEIKRPSLTLTDDFPSATPYIAYVDVANGNKITVMKYNYQ